MLPKKINNWYNRDYQRKHDQYAREHHARLADAIRAASGTQFVTRTYAHMSRPSQPAPHRQTAPDGPIVAVDVFLKR